MARMIAHTIGTEPAGKEVLPLFSRFSAQDTEMLLLCGEIDRCFGSMEDFRRSLRCCAAAKGGFVQLVCTDQGRLRLWRARQGAPPRGEALLILPASGTREPYLDLRALAARYERFLRCRARHPSP